MVDRPQDRSQSSVLPQLDASFGRHPPPVSDHRPRALSNSVYSQCTTRFTSALDPGGLATLAFLSGRCGEVARRAPAAPLYTTEERRRRDESPWTLVQGVLAPVQFAIFLASFALVLRYLATGDGFAAATVSVVVKTFALYAIMITGSIWEKDVFGRYLFARAFFWEDVFSMLVLALHTAYLAALIGGFGDARAQMWLALAAYATYLVNATQFLLKLRAARLEAPRTAAFAGAAS